MKIKKLKKITIGDCTFDIKWDKKYNGGEFQYAWKGKPAYIRIGIQEEKKNPERTLSVLIHELKEIIQVEQGTRYDKQDENKAYEFHYSHKEHTTLCSLLAGYLSKFL